MLQTFGGNNNTDLACELESVCKLCLLRDHSVSKEHFQHSGGDTKVQFLTTGN